MKTLDTIDDRVYTLIQFANKRAGYEKIEYNPGMTSQVLLQQINLLREEFLDDPETLKELEKLKYILESIAKKTAKYIDILEK